MPDIDGNKEPKLTVCVTTYNQANLITRCIDSIVQQQTNFNFEIIVGDDCSTDHTAEILRSYAEKYPGLFRLHLQPKNVGSTENFQQIHAMARGEYVAHCDGDDLFLPGKLQRQADYLDSHPEIVQVWHKMYLIDGNDQIIDILPKRFTGFLRRKLSLKDLALAYFSIGFHSSQMYRRVARSVYDRKVFTLDYFFALDIATKGYSAHINEFLGCYRTIPNSSLTTSASTMKIVDDGVAEAAVYFSERYPELYPVFYGNLWFRKKLIRYAGNQLSPKYLAIFNAFKKYKNPVYGIRSMLLYLSLYSDLRFRGLRKKILRSISKK
jgi:glycosyltransferase involved in cell wall biosynthesis